MAVDDNSMLIIGNPQGFYAGYSGLDQFQHLFLPFDWIAEFPRMSVLIWVLKIKLLSISLWQKLLCMLAMKS
jgi:hypothetical protein